MNLQMDESVAEQYRSPSQRMRVITESWAKQALFCPYCGAPHINRFENNRPVADFFCQECAEEYELKSKKTTIRNKINGGAYTAMIERIEAVNNPNFFFLQYGKADLQVKNLILVPKHFFSAGVIEKRRPLAASARRAGWTGCNILLRDIPQEGRIFLVRDGQIRKTKEVLSMVRGTVFLREYRLDARGWILDVLRCVNKIEGRDFTLKQMYAFETQLAEKHPENHHIKDKIRQQLQLLRDKGILEFNGRGRYRKR